MTGRIMAFIGFGVSLFLAHQAGLRDPVSYYVFWSVGGLMVGYFFLAGDSLSFWVSLLLALASFVAQAFRFYSASLFFFLGCFFAELLFLFCYRTLWFGEIVLSAERKKKSDAAVLGLTQKVADKEGSLHLMARQLGDITNLYELAKEFNDCLSHEKLVEVLREKVFAEIAFRKAALLVFAGEAEPPSVVRRFVIYPGESIEGSEMREDLTAIEKKIILIIHDRKDALFVQSPGEVDPSWFQDAEVYFPFAIFPLVVQEKVIALFLIEGVNEEDLPKFRVVAAELALHVKKIKLYDTVRELSIVDGLTNVFVRRHFLERFEEELKRSIRHGFHLAVLMLDIDHFKSYNDNYGHLVGDVTLREVAQVIVANVRRVDIVARYGGEEFGIVLPETDKRGGIEVAERIRSAVARKHFRAYDEETKVTVSIGVAGFAADIEHQPVEGFRSELIDELLRKADQAVYQAIEEGRNRVVVFGGLT